MCVSAMAKWVKAIVTSVIAMATWMTYTILLYYTSPRIIICTNLTDECIYIIFIYVYA